MNQKDVAEIISLLFIIPFLYYGINKLMNCSIFKEQLVSPPFSDSTAEPIAFSLLWVEFSLIVLLIVGIRIKNKLRRRNPGLASINIKAFGTIFLFILLTGCSDRVPEKTSHKGKLMPSFKLLLPDSTTWLDTKNIPADKPIVLFYFGPHCAYSRAEMNDIIKNIILLKNIRFYAFTPWPFQEMKAFYENYHVGSYPNIVMGVDTENFFGKHFETQGVPYIAIYGSNKRLKEIFIGQINSKQIKDLSDE